MSLTSKSPSHCGALLFPLLCPLLCCIGIVCHTIPPTSQAPWPISGSPELTHCPICVFLIKYSQTFSWPTWKPSLRRACEKVILTQQDGVRGNQSPCGRRRMRGEFENIPKVALKPTLRQIAWTASVLHVSLSPSPLPCDFLAFSLQRRVCVPMLWFGFGQGTSADMMHTEVWASTFPFALPVLLLCLHHEKTPGLACWRMRSVQPSLAAPVIPAKSMSILISQCQLSPRHVSGSH